MSKMLGVRATHTLPGPPTYVSGTARASRRGRLPGTRRAVVLASFVSLALVCGCGPHSTIQVPWIQTRIVDVVPSKPMLPLVAPSQTLKAKRGAANANYPANYRLTIKSDGSVVFPDGGPGRVKNDSVFVGGVVVATLSSSGELAGPGLKHRYKFDSGGELKDDDGHGVRVSPEGTVFGIGGKWRYQDVMVWTGDSGTTGDWDRAAWRTVAVLSVLMLENVLPVALRSG
ncbi:MAG: hypothetical protein U0169_17395 [Polyangiaceae bacterium]